MDKICKIGLVCIRLPIRGGAWNNGANAGVFSLNLNNPRSNANNNIGFRLALTKSRILEYTYLRERTKAKGDLDLTDKSGKNMFCFNAVSNSFWNNVVLEILY